MPSGKVLVHKGIKINSHGLKVPHLAVKPHNKFSIKDMGPRVAFPDDRFEIRHESEGSETYPYDPLRVHILIHQIKGL